ncbi:MAG: ABC transporter permease [Erysipelotrichaceae bacterium]
MLNITLFKREFKNSLPLLLIVLSIMTLYISIIIYMYDPNMLDMLNSFTEVMPEIMAMVGMTGATDSLLSFEASYLYGFILILFPMLYIITRNNSLIKKYIENNSMAALLAAPITRVKFALTQAITLISTTFILVSLVTLIQFSCGELMFPNETSLLELIQLNAGLFSLLLFIASLAFMANCIFNNSKIALAISTGLPIFMFVVQMIANLGGDMEIAKYFTFFTLFDPSGLINAESFAITGAISLALAAFLLFSVGILAFNRRDLHI